MSICVVTSFKGGVGKSTLAYNLAAATDSLLIDTEPESGGVSSHYNLDPTSKKAQSLVLSLRSDGLMPEPIITPSRPAIIPGHPDLALLQNKITSIEVKNIISHWNFDKNVIIDTPQGYNNITEGIIKVADLILCPMRPSELDYLATRHFCHDMASKRKKVILVPSIWRDNKKSRQILSHIQNEIKDLPSITLLRDNDGRTIHLPYCPAIEQRSSHAPLTSGQIGQRLHGWVYALSFIMDIIESSSRKSQ